MMIVAAAFIVAACEENPPLPQLAQGLPADSDSAESQFDARVKNRFPVGSSAQSMRRELGLQGFHELSGSDALNSTADTASGAGVAEYRRSQGSFCTEVRKVHWRADGDKLRDVKGQRFQRCV
jgi:hypothetical protein